MHFEKEESNERDRANEADEALRVQKIEERLAYCENLCDELNRALFELTRKISDLESKNLQLVLEVKRLREQNREPFSPELEKPPHY
ncbi:MAG: SlyX family protein [Planctomycetia bacterium]|nr:SlyX family protein [Planctomycetia bacterium]